MTSDLPHELPESCRAQGRARPDGSQRIGNLSRLPADLGAAGTVPVAQFSDRDEGERPDGSASVQIPLPDRPTDQPTNQKSPCQRRYGDLGESCTPLGTSAMAFTRAGSSFGPEHAFEGERTAAA